MNRFVSGLFVCLFLCVGIDHLAEVIREGEARSSTPWAVVLLVAAVGLTVVEALDAARRGS